MQYIFLICEQNITYEQIGNIFTGKWNIYSSHDHLYISPIITEINKKCYVQLEYSETVDADFDKEGKAVFAQLNYPKYSFVKYSDFKLLREVLAIISQNIYCYIDNDHGTTLESSEFMKKWSEEWSDDYYTVAQNWICEFEFDGDDPY